MDRPKCVLGLRLGPGHDTGAALVHEVDGELRCVAVAEERLSRDKNSRAFPELAIHACLREFDLGYTDLDAVVFEKTVWGYGAKWYEQIPGAAWPYFNDPKEHAFFDSLGDIPCYYANHHLLHAATAWHTTRWPLDNQPGCILVIDGRGSTWGDGKSGSFGPLHDFELCDTADGIRYLLKRVEHEAETQSVFIGRGRSIERVDVSLRSGVGFFYSWLTECVLGFGHFHAGKSMGLAAYGDPDSKSFPRFPDSCFIGIDTDLTDYIFEHYQRGEMFRIRNEEQPTEQYFADAAAWGQAQLSRAITHLAQHAIARTDARRLGYAGGVALNVVANRAVRDDLFGSGAIDDMFVQPAASDTGLALGAALLGYYETVGGRLPFQYNQVYLGPTHTSLVDGMGSRHTNDHEQRELINEVADLLMQNKIVGWYQGRSEHGPRALGSRSILCWPRADWMKDYLNTRVKHRESFRPFAPIIAEEHASEVFDVDFSVPHMLFNTMIRPKFLDRLPAVTHVDGSGRLQTVSREDAPLLHALLEEIRHRDGIGVLLNTSFNDNGEPIVETPADAQRCFETTQIDALVCDGKLTCKAGTVS